MSFVNAAELIYRSLSQPKPQEAKPARVKEEANKSELTRDDVTAIIARQRSATPEQLQYVIEHAKEFRLTTGERNELALQSTIAAAERARRVPGKRHDLSAQFIYDLGYALTPFGLLHERAWFEKELQSATQAIAACRRHITPYCSCWKQARENLYDIRASFGERSPESWAAIRIWEALEEMELASRPERIGNQLVDCRKVTITSCYASKLVWRQTAKCPSPATNVRNSAASLNR
ncbi:MAG: hypothetical protein WCF26_20730, partial [Candidatus Sulfotelmatobacter sp.]